MSGSPSTSSEIYEQASEMVRKGASDSAILTFLLDHGTSEDNAQRSLRLLRLYRNAVAYRRAGYQYTGIGLVILIGGVVLWGAAQSSTLPVGIVAWAAILIGIGMLIAGLLRIIGTGG